MHGKNDGERHGCLQTADRKHTVFVPLGGALDGGCSCMKLGFGGGSEVLVAEMPVQNQPQEHLQSGSLP